MNLQHVVTSKWQRSGVALAALKNCALLARRLCCSPGGPGIWGLGAWGCGGPEGLGLWKPAGPNAWGGMCGLRSAAMWGWAASFRGCGRLRGAAVGLGGRAARAEGWGVAAGGAKTRRKFPAARLKYETGRNFRAAQ